MPDRSLRPQVRPHRQRPPRGEPRHPRTSPARSTPWSAQSSRRSVSRPASSRATSPRARKAVTGALDSQTKLQAQTAREVAETGSMLAHRPSRSACEAVTGLRGLAAYWRRGQGRARPCVRDRDRPHHERPCRGRPAGGRRGRRRPLRDGDTGILQCSARGRGLWVPGTSVSGTSVSGTSVCRGDDALHGADLRAGTLFDRRTFASEAELRAAVELSRNLAAPVVHDPPRDGLGRYRPGAQAGAAGARGGCADGARRRLPGAGPGAPRAGRRARRLGGGDRARHGPRSRTFPSAATSFSSCWRAAASRTRTGSSASRRCRQKTCCASWSRSRRSR